MATRPKLQAGEITSGEAATMLLMTVSWLNQMQNLGQLPRGRIKGVVDRDAVAQAYVRFLKGERKAKTHVAAENRVREARAREIEIRNAERDHRLIELTEAMAVTDEIVGMLRSEIIGLPARVTRDRQLRARLDAEILDTLNRASTRLAERGRVLRASGEALGDDGEDWGAGMGPGSSGLSADDGDARTS